MGGPGLFDLYLGPADEAPPSILDLFAGPGGWDEGLRRHLGITDVLGVEVDAAACATRAAAGHKTLMADVAELDPARFAGITGLLASPPCQDFSSAGTKVGRAGRRGQLIDTVPPFVEELAPEWVACEQVPQALEVWQEHAARYEALGYTTWCGILNAADYGAPQARRRAILLAHRSRPSTPPAPTHLRHVSMAEALPERAGVELNTGRDWKKGGSRIDAQTIPTTMPAPTVTGVPGQWLWQDDRTYTESVTLAEALVLQTFDPDYPVKGATAAKQWEQVGNAVPPRLAGHIVAAITGATFTEAVTAEAVA